MKIDMNMKKCIFGILALVAIFGLTLVKTSAKTHSGAERKIIVWKHDVKDFDKDRAVAAVKGWKVKKLQLVNATAVVLPDGESERALNALKQNPHVLRVDDDVMVEAFLNDGYRQTSKTAGWLAEVLPWGIDRIEAEQVWPLSNTANPIKVGIIDTGISNRHPDLLANIKGGVNTIHPFKSWNDDNGHGSHVAGIVAALDNAIGAVGVGPQIDLYAIKALNANGSGYLSDIIEGIEWAIANNMQVINMSFGTALDIQSFHDAVTAAKNAGIVVVAAAGNSGRAVSFPAAYPETIAVSATDQNNILAPWSNRGPEVDLAAPGVSIYSTYKGTGYATFSGTSMASPHVAGSVALVLNTPVGAYDANANGKWDPDEVQKKLQDRATDLGDAGFDHLYGWGLVNAFAATQ